MKQIKYFVVALFAALALASCNTDQEGAIYTPTVENVSLAMKTQSYQTENQELDIPVRFLRANKNGEYTAHYTFATSNEAVLPDAAGGTVTFADGEAEKTVVFHANGMQKGYTYKAKISLSDDDIAQGDTITNNAIYDTNISVMCDYEWEKAGTATFTDFTFSEDEDNGTTASKPVQIMHAVTNDVHLYKLVAPYYTTYGDVSAVDIKFYLNDDYSPAGFGADAQYDIFPEYGYKVYWDTARYAAYNYWANEGNRYEANFIVTNGTSLYPAGYFTFVWNGWPGSKK